MHVNHTEIKHSLILSSIFVDVFGWSQAQISTKHNRHVCKIADVPAHLMALLPESDQKDQENLGLSRSLKKLLLNNGMLSELTSPTLYMPQA